VDRAAGVLTSIIAWGVVSVSSCVPAQEPMHTPRTAPAAEAWRTTSVARRDSAPVVLVVLDGVRWQEVFRGIDANLARGHAEPVVGPRTLLPHLYAAIDERGAVIGAPGRGRTIAATGPNFISMPGYTEIFQGRPPEHCQNNDCPPPDMPTLVDEVRGAVASDADVAVFASWPGIGRVAAKTRSGIVLSAGRRDVVHAELLTYDSSTRGALESGAEADPYPGDDDFRPDRYTGALALAYLELQRPAFLFVGLGEPDEFAHRGDYAGYVRALRRADDFLGGLFASLDRMEDRGRRTLVLVATDHGRAADYRDHGGAFPESARVWLGAFGSAVQARGLLPASRHRRLTDIAPTVRRFMGLPPDDSKNAGSPVDELFDRPDALDATLALH
jgi:hypothetical protein